MNFNFMDTSTVAAGNMNNIVEGNGIDNKKNCKLKFFGAVDINMGDSKSSVWVLQWGSGTSWETIKILSLTGNTKNLELDRVFEGDGVKKFRVIRRNYSSTNKELAFWIEGQLG